MDMTTINVRVPTELLRQFDEEARERFLTRSALIRHLMTGAIKGAAVDLGDKIPDNG